MRLVSTSPRSMTHRPHPARPMTRRPHPSRRHHPRTSTPVARVPSAAASPRPEPRSPTTPPSATRGTPVTRHPRGMPSSAGSSTCSSAWRTRTPPRGRTASRPARVGRGAQTKERRRPPRCPRPCADGVVSMYSPMRSRHPRARSRPPRHPHVRSRARRVAFSRGHPPPPSSPPPPRRPRPPARTSARSNRRISGRCPACSPWSRARVGRPGRTLWPPRLRTSPSIPPGRFELRGARCRIYRGAERSLGPRTGRRPRGTCTAVRQVRARWRPPRWDRPLAGPWCRRRVWRWGPMASHLRSATPV